MKQGEAGVKTADLCREHGISAATFFQWKQKFGGMDVAEAQRLKATGRMVCILSVLDAHTRECLSLEGDTSLGSGRVTRVLDS